MRLYRKLLQSSERTARHSAGAEWHSDRLFADSDSFVACVAVRYKSSPLFLRLYVLPLFLALHRKLLQSSERTARHSAGVD
jgi:hypothetical protein